VTKELYEVQEEVRKTILEKLSVYNLPANILVEDVPMQRGKISLQTFERYIVIMMHNDITENSFWVRQEIASQIVARFSKHRFTGDMEHHEVYIFMSNPMLDTG